MPKFRKRPVEIEAVQLTKYNLVEVAGWCEHLFVDDDLEVYISTLEGNMHVSQNDWVIKGVHGEFYPCKPDIFVKTYEPVEDKEPSEYAAYVDDNNWVKNDGSARFSQIYDGHYNDHDPLE